MSHRTLSIATAAAGLALCLGGNLANAATDQYYARWTVSDDKPAYSAKGKLYKTIDIAPCGKDFCGVSVDENNKCGKILFRFFTTHPTDEDITGHGSWGAVKKKLTIGYATPQDEKAYMYLGIGEDDMDIGGREGSTPTFQANYKNMGQAGCTAE